MTDDRPSGLNILVLYDEGSTHVGTIREHLEAFRAHSAHNILYLAATGYIGVSDRGIIAPNFSAFDAVIVHYSIRLSVESHLSRGIARALADFGGPKLLFIQDEYDNVEITRRAIERLGITQVFTCIPAAEREKVYPAARFGSVAFLPTLTGYVPETSGMEAYSLPTAARRLRIAYRGRALPHHYGALGREKYRIGIDVRRLAEARSVPVDIEVDEDHRIYGSDWYRFIGSARATLGTESGSNIFDFDGALARLSARHADMPFEEFAARYLAPHEGAVRMNQISPKIFEAIRLRTALVLFDGAYSGAVQPHRHYIPLAKDYSNIEEVFTKLEDVPALEAMTERAYDDIILSGNFSYRTFVAGVDAAIERQSAGRGRTGITPAPALALHRDGSIGAVPEDSTEVLILRDRIPTTGSATKPGAEAGASTSTAGSRAMRGIWHMLPQGLRATAVDALRALADPATEPRGLVSRVLKSLWVRLPARLRDRIMTRLG